MGVGKRSRGAEGKVASCEIMGIDDIWLVKKAQYFDNHSGEKLVPLNMRSFRQKRDRGTDGCKK